MSKPATFINDVYQGLYYYAVKYESAETAKSLLNLRLAITFYFYYFSFILFAIPIRGKIYSPSKAGYFEALIVMFGIYFLLYKYIIKASVVVSTFDDLPDERMRKVRLCLWTFSGSIACFIATFTVIYFISKK